MEHKIQNAIRNALCGQGIFFRANVGQAWTGSKISRLPDGAVHIQNARPFNSGLPRGFSDLFGFKSVKITPDMVGQEIAVFTAIEVKGPRGRVSEYQKNFLNAVKTNGGLAGVARSVDDAVEILKNENLEAGR